MTDKIYAGYYTLEVSKYAEHTYAYIKPSRGKTVYFHCYGGINGPHNVVPASLRKPLRIWEKLRNQHQDADLFKARCIAQFSYVPKIKEHYSSKKGGIAFGDSSGILYAVTGVCHQMCNRILYAMKYRTNLFLLPHEPGIVLPPSFALSRLLYLNDGSLPSQPPWKLFLHHLSKLSAESVVYLSAAAKKQLERTHRAAYGASLRNLKEEGYSEATSSITIHGLLFDADPKKDWRKTNSSLSKAHYRLQKRKQDLDHLLVKGAIKNNNYAESLNEEVRAFVKNAERDLPDHDFRAAFNAHPGEEMPDVIAARDMPDSGVYKEAGAVGKF